jgi:hypothetical protein
MKQEQIREDNIHIYSDKFLKPEVIAKRKELSNEISEAKKLILKNPSQSENRIITAMSHKYYNKSYSEYFLLARCQEILDKHKEALVNYRLTCENLGTSFLHYGFYSLCAIRNRQYGEYKQAMEKVVENIMYDIGNGEKYIQPVVVTSNVNIMKAYASYILSIKVEDDPLFSLVQGEKAIQEWRETKGRIFYLKQAIELGRGTVPGAYIQLAKLQSRPKPLEAQKTLDNFIQKYEKRYPQFVLEAKEIRKTIYVP